jgi:hypothetical protein
MAKITETPYTEVAKPQPGRRPGVSKATLAPVVLIDGFLGGLSSPGKPLIYQLAERTGKSALRILCYGKLPLCVSTIDTRCRDAHLL